MNTQLKTWIKHTVLATTALFAFACGDDPSTSAEIGYHQSALSHDESPDPSAESREANLNANLNLTFTLHREALEEPGNAMLSAFSARQAFGLLYPGAVGETKETIAEVIGFDHDVDSALETLNAVNDTLASRRLPADNERNLESVELHTANAFFGAHNRTWKESYLDLLSEHLDTGIYALNFKDTPEASRQTINELVEDQTRGRIKNLIPKGQITDLTRAVLTNAIYFKAPWQSKFEKESTFDRPFVLSDGTEVNVPMMRQSSQFRHASNDELTSIDLPFRGGELVMTLVSPKNTSLDEFTASLTPEKWTDITENQTAGEVNIMMPKFEFETTQNLKPALKNMGLGSLFVRPDLSGMTDDEPLKVSGVFQKTFIKVEEGGTEAAAATAIVVGTTASVEPEPTIINMNQPFVFAIRDTETGHILFFGRVMDPR